MQNPPRVTSSGTAEIDAAPEARRAPASIAPVGLEMADTELLEEAPVRPPAMQTGSIRVPPRRRLGGIVFGTLGGCALILVAAVVARVSHASSARHDAMAATGAPDTSPAAASPAGLRSNASPSPASNGGSSAPSPASAAAAPSPAGAAAAGLPTDRAAAGTAGAATTGTVRLQRPAAAGRVWLDGKKVSSSSVVVACGAHQIRVGARARAHAVQVPCGGEVAVAK